jgi:hypothetical protein
VPALRGQPEGVHLRLKVYTAETLSFQGAMSFTLCSDDRLSEFLLASYEFSKLVGERICVDITRI